MGRFERAGLSYGHGTASAADEAAWLILHSLGLPAQDIHPHLERQLTESESKSARALVEKRVRSRKPAGYLLREAWLGPYRFYVDERVIVPRSFIGHLLMAEGQGARGKGQERRTILDLCTGSGCLAIVAAKQFPDASVDAADLSEDALAVARRNVREYGLQDRVRLVKSDLFARLGGRKYDLIVSNPPYVKAASMRTLPAEHRREPAMALASGVDGLDHTRAILAQAGKHLTREGLLVVEIGHNRKALEKSFPQLPFRWPRIRGGTGLVFALPAKALAVLRDAIIFHRS